MNTTDPKRQNLRHSSLRWQALFESAVLVAIAAAAVLVLLLLAGAPAPYLLVAWGALVTDVLVLRIAALRIRQTVERVPVSLKPWRRDDPRPVVCEV